ncbi:glycoside hydrolase family 16 protein [Clavulina sp. PMI_390]|nr:glycoside hydrolase family 16 protein [Clavulina sp. PMI_390]
MSNIDSAGAYSRLEDHSTVDDDDFIHEPDKKGMKVGGSNWRGFFNVLVLILILLALVALFAGYPIISWATRHATTSMYVNGTGQVPDLIGLPSLIDPDTPKEVYTRTGFDGKEYELVFSDEFNKDGRSFFPGDDPFWEGVNLWYGSTQDLEYYEPGQITTRDGHLVIVLEMEETYGLPFKSGMLQSWNKFCFTTGYIEVSTVFPGDQNVAGYWPGAWFMGNLGRPGYESTGDGLWPYSYDSCDVGTLPNQTDSSGNPSIVTTAGGNPKYNNNLSWLPGQRLSACTCPGEDHPGPDINNPIGRSSPEIDIFEGQKNKVAFGGRVTQSVQMAPFSNQYYFPNTSADVTIYNSNSTSLNTYRGSALQQAVSALTNLNSTTYAENGADFTTFGVEYWSNPSNRDEGFITWVAGGPVFTIDNNVFTGDPTVNISARLIPEEPMSIILNLAVSESFQTVDSAAMTFPSELRFDYVRVWQRKGISNGVGCDPPNRPTAKYINDHLDAYTNANYTLWADAGYKKPKNSLVCDLCPDALVVREPDTSHVYSKKHVHRLGAFRRG